MPVKEYPVVIVGGGPAGAVASLSLSKAGQPHLLLDKGIFPRDKVCGDAVSGKSIEVLYNLVPEAMMEFSRGRDALHTKGIQFVAPNGNSVDIAFPKSKTPAPIGLVAKREAFDHFLFSQVDRSTAEVWQDTEVVGAGRNGDGLILKLKREGKEHEVRTPLVIGADGSRSIVKRALQGDDQDDDHFCGAIRAYYSGVKGLHSDNFLEMHFLKEFLPGYFWIFPLPGGYANVGMGMLSKYIKKKRINLRKDMLEAIHTHPSLRARFADAQLEGKIVGWGLPLGSKKRQLSGSNFILTGDAASLIDPSTGEGIGNAAISGLIAAEHALRAVREKQYSAAALAAYDRAIYDKLWDELRISYNLQKLFAYPRLFNFVVNRIRSSRGLQELFTNMFIDLDMRAQMQNPFFYLRLLFR